MNVHNVIQFCIALWRMLCMCCSIIAQLCEFLLAWSLYCISVDDKAAQNHIITHPDTVLCNWDFDYTCLVCNELKFVTGLQTLVNFNLLFCKIRWAFSKYKIVYRIGLFNISSLLRSLAYKAAFYVSLFLILKG